MVQQFVPRQSLALESSLVFVCLLFVGFKKDGVV